MKELRLMDSAATSISDGDLVDSLIHGFVGSIFCPGGRAHPDANLYRPEQHWGLMPLHAVCSTVKPASYLYGMGAHYGGPNAMSFPQ